MNNSNFMLAINFIICQYPVPYLYKIFFSSLVPNYWYQLTSLPSNGWKLYHQSYYVTAECPLTRKNFWCLRQCQWKTEEFPCHVNVHFLVSAVLQLKFEYNFITATLIKTEADDNFEPLQKILVRATNLFESLIRKSHTSAIC